MAATRIVEWKRVPHAADFVVARYEGRSAATGRKQVQATTGLRTRNANVVWASRGWFLVVVAGVDPVEDGATA